MTKQANFKRVAVSILLAGVLLVGCGTAAPKQADLVELNFVSSNNTHGISLDPAVEYCGARNVSIGAAETLFKLNDETLEVEGHLASGYEHPDDTTWQITLRDNITFSSGKKLTAKEAKESLEYILASIARLATMLDVASMEADGQLLTIKTNSKVATLPRILSDTGTLIFDLEGTEDYAAGVVGTGPYILQSMDSDGNCQLIKNTTYWQGMPGADKVNTKFISDTSATAMALQSGELDYATVSSGDVALFENNEDYEVVQYENGRAYFLYINPEFTFTQDAALRSALGFAFNRQAYVDGIYDGRGKTTTTIFPQWSGYSTAEVTQNEYDLEQAKRLLAEAGYTDGDSDGFVEKDGQKVVLQITCYPNNGFPALSEAIQASLKELGIDSEITVSDAIVADLGKGNFNIATYGYTTLTMGDCANFLEPVFQTGGSSNFNHFSSPEVDALLEELKTTSDTAERKQLAIEMQKEIFASDQHVFLLHISSYQVIRKGVQNVTTGLGDHFNLWKIAK